MFSGGADVIVRVFIKTIEAQNSLSFFLWAGGSDGEGQPFIAAAYALPVRDGHAHSGLFDNNRIALRPLSIWGGVLILDVGMQSRSFPELRPQSLGLTP
jgi:hypothetical protein